MVVLLIAFAIVAYLVFALVVARAFGLNDRLAAEQRRRDPVDRGRHASPRSTRRSP